MTTTRLVGGRIVDGSGAPAFDGNVVIEDGRILSVERAGSAAGAPVDRTVALEGRVVAPGFIDMHSHADFLVPNADNDDLMRAFLEQGVTTIVAGNCGISPAPCQSVTLARHQRLSEIAVDRPFDWSWRGMGEYLEALDEAGLAVNVAQLVGHGSARFASSQCERGDLGQDLESALDAARRALDEGSCGLSFGLGYDPGMYSSLDELEAFARVAARADKPVTVHLKAYSWLSPTYPLASTWEAHNLRALDEMLGVAERAEAALQVSHFIFVGRRTWATAARALERIDTARARGQDVMIDAFPYTCGNTTINVTLPYWFLAMGPAAYRSRTARTRARIETELGYRLVGLGWEDFQVMSIGVPEWEPLNGLSLGAIARRWNMRAFDALLAISERSDGGALVLIHGYSGDRAGQGPIRDVLTHEACLYETDAIVRSEGWPNPAAVGTFPKILADQVRRDGALRLEEAVRRMTGASAARFGLDDCGTIAAGRAADLVVFDPNTVSDVPPGPGRPAERPVGIDRVFVNGQEVVTDGVASPLRAGRVLPV
ncbi:MAG: amidohydrolase family protein [Sandaracinaceae bacterium]